MGWYMHKTQRLNGVAKSDAYGQYLNYHEGWTGYRNRSYDRKAWLKTVSQKVKARAELHHAVQELRTGPDARRLVLVGPPPRMRPQKSMLALSMKVRGPPSTR